MALVVREEGKVALNNETLTMPDRPPIKKNVLDEESHTKNLEEIIERDFFPDTRELKEQAEYIQAVEQNDLVKLREIQMRGRMQNGSIKRRQTTPLSFETPDVHNPEGRKEGNSSPQQDGEPPTGDDYKAKGPKKLQSLDRYLAKNTSEDNASFAEILEETQKKHREKHAWLYENEVTRKQEEEDRLALPSAEEQAAITDGKASVNTWKYTTRNSLMYVPDGANMSVKEYMDAQKAKSREIVHENTRFKESPWNQQKNTEMIKHQASLKAFMNMGKLGHDGKEVTTMPSPQVNGYGFVGTPSPMPGVEDSPLMTWGEIESTPARITGSETPSQNGPNFKIPEVPYRDRLAMELAEKASKTHRDKKEKALKSVQARLASPSPKFGMSTTDRLSTMSPAAQRLATSRLGVRRPTDKALQASYSPSPARGTPGNTTPVSLTPKSVHRDSGSQTPGSKRGGNTPISLTDDLLQLPKRKKAADFF